MKKYLWSFFLAIILLLLSTRPTKAQMINEFYPKSPEWVEFYNDKEEEINLLEYYFDDDSEFDSDIESSHIFQLTGILPSRFTCYWNLSTFLNDTGDTPTLFKSDKSIVDTYQYSDPTSGKSYSRVPDGGSWQADQNPSKSSVSCQSLTPSPTATTTPTLTPTSAPTSAPTPTPTSVPTKAPTPKPTVKPTAKPTDSPTSSPEVLGEQVTPTPSPSPVAAAGSKVSYLPFVMIGLGVIAIGGALYPFFKSQLKAYNERSAQGT